MNEGDTKVIVVFVDGTTKEFWADSPFSHHNHYQSGGVFVWENATVDHRSVDYYSIPFWQVREIYEYE